MYTADTTNSRSNYEELHTKLTVVSFVLYSYPVSRTPFFLDMGICVVPHLPACSHTFPFHYDTTRAYPL